MYKLSSNRYARWTAADDNVHSGERSGVDQRPSAGPLEASTADFVCDVASHQVYFFFFFFLPFFFLPPAFFFPEPIPIAAAACCFILMCSTFSSASAVAGSGMPSICAGSHPRCVNIAGVAPT